MQKVTNRQGKMQKMQNMCRICISLCNGTPQFADGSTAAASATSQVTAVAPRSPAPCRPRLQQRHDAAARRGGRYVASNFLRVVPLIFD